jgi:hypothetical protein
MAAPSSLNPTAQRHLDQARRNYRCYERLRLDGEFLDWAVTALFYTALHLVLAHAAQHGHSLTDDHGAIRRYVDRYLVSIRRTYRELFDASRDTRYLGLIPDAAAVGKYHDGQYRQIETQLRNRGVSL